MMNVERSFGVGAGVISGLAVLYYLYGPRLQDLEQRLMASREPAAVEAPPAPAPAAPTPPTAARAPEFPVPDAESAPEAPPAPAPQQPAPAVAPDQDLAASDPSVRASIAAVFGQQPVDSFLVPDRVIQNIVTTVDSLDREPVPLRFRAIVDVPEVMTVERQGDSLTLAPANAQRYSGLISALKSTDAKSITALYLRYYPLLQRAYREMGYPDGYFNDRVVHIIDHLLATPPVDPPIVLKQPKVLYVYADPQLEGLSSGQKIMLRIGPANAALVKTRLAEIRAILVSGKAPH